MSTAGFSQLQGLDKITDVRGGQNNGGKLSEIFLHPCLLLRKNCKTEGWREDGLRCGFLVLERNCCQRKYLDFLNFFL